MKEVGSTWTSWPSLWKVACREQPSLMQLVASSIVAATTLHVERVLWMEVMSGHRILRRFWKPSLLVVHQKYQGLQRLHLMSMNHQVLPPLQAPHPLRHLLRHKRVETSGTLITAWSGP